MTTAPNNSSLFLSFIVWLHIVAHSAICICDYTQWIPLVDFIQRHDGSASDPKDLLPLELVYAGLTAMSFGTVGFAFVMAELTDQTTRSFAALLSVFFHGMWFLHMSWRWEAWTSMMHPDGSMKPEFFLATHGTWTVLSLVLLIMSPEKNSETKRREDPKRK